jgi:hypothetical protein
MVVSSVVSTLGDLPKAVFPKLALETCGRQLEIDTTADKKSPNAYEVA